MIEYPFTIQKLEGIWHIYFTVNRVNQNDICTYIEHVKSYVAV